MNKKKIFGSVAVLAIAAMAAFNVQINMNEKNQLTDLNLANAEALAGETDVWEEGFKTDNISIGGIIMPCCVPSSTTDACNFGVVNCIRNQF